MHIITHNSTGENSIKIPINTRSEKIIFNDANYNNITLYIDNPISLKDSSHNILLSISSFQIPISWPIISNYLGNNIFEYTINGTTYNYIIPDGSYSANDLKTLFNSNTLLLVTYSKTTGKYIFTHDTYNFSITNNTTCYYEIGFDNDTYTSTLMSLSSIKPIDLGGSRSIYIKSNLSTDNYNIYGKTSNIIDIIPINVSNFDILRYTNSEGFKMKIHDQSIYSINIILEDDHQNKIDINNDWELVLELNKIVNSNYPLTNNVVDKPNIQDIIES